VLIWNYDKNSWNKYDLGYNFSSGITGLSWSSCGSFLCISSPENNCLYKQSNDSTWGVVSSLNQYGSMEDFEEEK